MEHPKLDRALECPNGHKYKIPNRDQGLPAMLICGEEEFKVPTKSIGQPLAQEVASILSQELDGLQVKVTDMKLIVNERLELNVLLQQLWDRLNMKWYFYGNNPSAVVKRLLSL